MNGLKGREWRAGGRKHGWSYIVKYTSDNHGGKHAEMTGKAYKRRK
jgi:hypothetical protein